VVEGDLSRRVQRIRLTLIVAALACAWVVLGSPVNAEAAGSFSCRAMGHWKAATTVANPAGSPCINDDAVVGGYRNSFGVYIPPGTYDCIPVCRGEPYGYSFGFAYSNAYTRRYAGTGYAYAGFGDGYIYGEEYGNPIPNPVYIEIKVAAAYAEASCSAPSGSPPQLSGYSSVAYTYAGVYHDPTIEPIDIDLGPAYLGVLHLNAELVSSGEIVERAVWWDIPGQGDKNDLIIGEARAGFSGNPCV
jgi:hypothetical protein